MKFSHERRAHHRHPRRRQHRDPRGSRGRELLPVRPLGAQEVYAIKARGYRPIDHYNGNQALRDVIDLIRSGFFSRGDSELFRPLIDGLLYHDPYLLLADFQSYIDCQAKVSEAYRDTERWTRMSILNTARSGKFSSDRTIREYCTDIWHVDAVPINLLTHEQAGTA